MTNLIQKSEQYIFQLFKDKLSSDYTYHNFLHTQFVVSKLSELIHAEKLTDSEEEILLLAAWFHDSGYTCCDGGHEDKSAEIAAEFLRENGVDPDKIAEVEKLILATKIGYEPQNLMEMMIKDADTAHLGTNSFEKTSLQLRREWERTLDQKLSDSEWYARNSDFLTSVHRFYTDYAKLHWQPVKLNNLIKVQDNIANQKENEQKAKLKKSKLEKLDKPDRGIDTLFRVTLNNHTRLSDIADSKANILLSVNAIIISIALSTLLPKLASAKNEYLVIPTLTMLTVSVVCIIFAIMATKPNVSKTTFTETDVKNRKVNLLFFGNFHKMDLLQFEEAMNDLMSDRKYLYNSLTRDLYYLGLVLERKYRLLRITYYLFMIGTILTVVSFVYAFSENTEFDWLLGD